MKKITPVEIFIIFLVVIGIAFYLIPKLSLKIEQKEYGRMQANAAMMTSKVLAEFSDNKNEKTPDIIAQNLVQEMNKLVKNPIDKKQPAYSINEECLGCVVLTPDNKLKNIVLTGKDREDSLILRTVIQPPSFVTYAKDFSEK